MVNDETSKANNETAWARCQQCDAELRQEDKACPECGSTKKRIVRVASTVVGVRTSSSVTHRPLFDLVSFGILVAVVAGMIAAIAVFVPPCAWIVGAALGAAVVIALAVFMVNHRMRYAYLMFVRQLPKRLAGKKTFGDRKAR